MKKILFIISKKPDDSLKRLLLSPFSSEHYRSAILIQQGIRVQELWPFSCFVLEDAIRADNINDLPVSYSKIQYSDMLDMILESDTVISL